jgi:hypothetical protein
MRARWPVTVAALAYLVAVPLACSGTDPDEPGTVLGTYSVTGTLKTNTCGAGQAPNPWDFSVKLSTDPGTLYWIQGSLPVAGTLSTANVAALTSTSTQASYLGDSSVPLCAIDRTDTLSATLVPDPTLAHEYSAFSGTLTYAFTQDSASTDCSSALTENGGGYAALPCSVSYTLSATRTALANQYGK